MMASHTAPFGSVLPSLRSALHVPQAARRPTHAVEAAPATPWLERLAAWAERQPVHRHLGSWIPL
jgi:hypothetical protein